MKAERSYPPGLVVGALVVACASLTTLAIVLFLLVRLLG